MVQEGKLAAVLSEFARTLVTEFPIQGILDHLVERIVDVLPVTGVGVTLISPGLAPQYVAASNPAALRFEQLQTAVGQGPCLLAYQSGAAVTVPDLAADTRFPQFAPPAMAAGLAAVFTFPLHHGEGRLGALDLYRDTPGLLDERDLAAAQILADVASAYLINAQSREDAQQASDQFRSSSLHDSLTGLPNRVLLQQRLEHASQRAERSGTFAGVLFVDLDQFKAVNDTHGHEVGDQMLRAVAERLASVVRPGDTLARMYGDEFVFLCEDLSSVAEVEALAERVVRAFDQPFVLPGRDELRLAVSASVGLAYAGPGEDISHQLVIDADAAMYQAKRGGGANHQVIDLRVTHEVNDRKNLRRDMQAAFAGEGLDLAYQPLVRVADGQLTGVESLLRWTDPFRGAVPARTMINIAEQDGLMAQLGTWVLTRACADYAGWTRRHPGIRLDLSVNVSVHQLMGPGFGAMVGAVLEETGVDPGAVVLEMTEGLFIDDTERAMTVLDDLKSLGVRLALDDFGTGYSGLSHLRQFAIDIVKLDQSVIAKVGDEPDGTELIGALAHLAHVLGLTVAAEGVETEVQAAAISAAGCDIAQGFLYAHPMPDAEMAALLDTHAQQPVHLPRAANGGGSASTRSGQLTGGQQT